MKLEQGHALWGKTQRATPSGGVFPSNPPQDGPPDLGIARICWGVFTSRYSTDFHRFIWTFLGDYSSHSRVVFALDYLFTWLHVFFSDDVLRRNQIIKEVVLVEASSILPLPR